MDKQIKQIQDNELKEFYKLKVASIWRYFVSTKLAFWMACLYMIVEYVRPQSIYAPIENIQLGKISIIGMLAAALLSKQVRWQANPLNKYLVFYFLLILLSGVFAINPDLTYQNLDRYLLWLLVYFLLVSIIDSQKKYFIFILLFVLVNLKMTQHGFFAFAARGFLFDKHGVVGAPGWFKNSGEFGIQLTIIIPVFIYFIIALKPHLSKVKLWILYFLPLSAFVSVAATSSRGAMLGTVAAMLVILFKNKRKFRAIFPIALAVLLIYAFIPEESLQRFDTAGEDSTSEHRLVIWGIGLDEMNKSPMLGVGFANWEEYYTNYYPEQRGSAMMHNAFLQAGTELGYTGLVLLLLIILKLFYLNYKVRKYSKESGDNFSYHMSNALDAGLVGFMVSGSFVTVLYYPYLWMHAVFVAALYNISRKNALNHSAKDE